MAIEAALRDGPRQPVRPEGGALAASVRTLRARPGSWWRRIGRADRLALTLLVVLPIVLYVPFSLAGHPVLPGDDLTQNYPLRLLAGEMLRSGRLPTWNPLIWSGTPLLAGWNGGSMFPATWLFAVLPGIAAWTVTYVANAVVASLGAYVLLRRLGCASPASTLGALAFTYTGFMSGQVVHLGLVQGTGLMPWTLVALDAMWRRSAAGAGPAGLAGPAALLGAASGLTVLAGDPRAVTTTAVVDLVYLLALLGRSAGHRLALAGASLGAVVVGGLLSAVQWLPGLRFVHSSQRGTTAYGFFGGGSLSLAHLASFVLAPFLFGGNGNLGMPTYAGTYNLPELTIGVGVLATVAFMAFLPALATSVRDRLAGHTGGGSHPVRPAGAVPVGEVGGRRLGIWYVLAVAGVVLALGTNTPLGQLLVHVPLFGGERLQNRNAAILDLALVVLLAFLVDDLLERPATSPLRSRAARLLGVVPLVATTALVVLAYGDPAAMRSFMSVSPSDTGLFTGMTPDLVWELVVVAGAAWIVLHPGRTASRRGRAGLVALALLDVGLFVANAGYGGAPSAIVGGPNPVSRQIGRLEGAQGRYALYNPLGLSAPIGSLVAAGAPDLNVVQANPSVQGYGSIVASSYDNATSTHGYENLAVGQLARSTFDVLDLRTLLTLPAYFEDALTPGQAPPAPGSAVAGSAGTAAAGTAAAVVGGPYRIPAHGRRTFLLASPAPVLGADVGLVAGTVKPAGLRLSLTRAGGVGGVGGRPAVGVVPLRGGQARATFPGGPRAGGIVVANDSSRTVDVATVVATVGPGRQRLALDGPLQGAVTAPHWRYQGGVGPLVAWENTRSAGLAWLEPAGATVAGRSAGIPGIVRVVRVSTAAHEEVAVDTPRPALVVRSETYSPGWTARLTPVGGGPTRVVPVEPLGLVQAVPVPAGRYELTWRYAPAAVLGGLVASAAGIVGLVVLAALALRHRRAKGALSWEMSPARRLRV